MPTLWFILVAAMLTMYVLLDGFDLGVGTLHLVAARTEQERRIVLRTIGPVWDGNEVWLIAAAGTLFFSFPLLYASSFSGFYLPLTIVLWLLVARGLAIELRSRVDNQLWRAFWDVAFFAGSALLALFFGTALGNVIRGVPLDAHGIFFVALWTDFNPFSQRPGLLDWYTLLVGLMAIAVLLAHGANYLAVKTSGVLQERAWHLSRRAWLATLVLTTLATVATFWVQPQIFKGFLARPWGAIFPCVALAGLLGMGYFASARRALPAFFSSGAFIAGMLGSTALGLYPVVLPAVNPANNLTVSNTAAHPYGLLVGLVWWSIGMVLACLYFVVTYRLFWGKITQTQADAHY